MNKLKQAIKLVSQHRADIIDVLVTILIVMAIATLVVLLVNIPLSHLALAFWFVSA